MSNQLRQINKNNKQRAAQVNLSPEQVRELDTIICTNCHTDAFLEARRMKKLPTTHPGNPTGRPMVIPVPVVVCVCCGKEIQL